jgi:hypothetical protein
MAKAVIKDMLFMDVVSYAVPGNNDMIRPFRRDENGYLSGRAIIAGVGIQTYKTSDGKTLRVLREPDQVFDSASIRTLAMLPLVVRHPNKNFTPETIQNKQVGSLGEDIINDAYYVYAPIVVTAKKAQDLIATGEMKELSIGYRAGLVFDSGEWQGQAYDAKQVNIRGNHVAIVKKARAGSAASFVMADGHEHEIDFEECDAVLMDDLDTTLSDKITQPNNPKGGHMAKFTLKNGQVVEADQSFIDSHTAILAENEALKSRVSDLSSGESDLKAKLAAKDVELKDAQANTIDDAEVERRAREINDVRDTAKAAGVEFKDSDSVKALKIAVVKKVLPDAEFSDDNETEVSAFFNAASKVNASKLSQAKDTRRKLSGTDFKDQADTVDKNIKKEKASAADLEHMFHDRLQDAHLIGGKE